MQNFPFLPNLEACSAAQPLSYPRGTVASSCRCIISGASFRPLPLAPRLSKSGITSPLPHQALPFYVVLKTSILQFKCAFLLHDGKTSYSSAYRHLLFHVTEANCYLINTYISAPCSLSYTRLVHTYTWACACVRFVCTNVALDPK